MQTIYRRLLKSVGKKLAARLRKGYYAQLNVRALVNRFFSYQLMFLMLPTPGLLGGKRIELVFLWHLVDLTTNISLRPSGRFSFVERACSTPSSAGSCDE
jgi:hypothetical protein